MTKLTRTFKRKGGARRRLNFNTKKRRVTRRGRKSNAFTSQSGSGGSINYKARKTGRRAYRKHLWDSTLFKEHYRSIGSTATTFTTPVSTSTISVLAEKAIANGSGSDFYTALGGALAPDALMLLPTFTGDVTIRGGKMGLRLANALDPVASARTLQGTVMLIRTTKAYNPAAITTPQPIGWDTSLIPDFDTVVGKVIYRKNFLLGDAQSSLIEYRIPLQKIDTNDFRNTLNTFVWVILAGNVDANLAQSMVVTKYFNLSFSADAV